MNPPVEKLPAGAGEARRGGVDGRDRRARRAIDDVVPPVLVAESDERAAVDLEEVGRAREVEVVLVRRMGLVDPTHVPVVEVEGQERVARPTPAVGDDAVAGPDDHEPDGRGRRPASPRRRRSRRRWRSARCPRARSPCASGRDPCGRRARRRRPARPRFGSLWTSHPTMTVPSDDHRRGLDLAGVAPNRGTDPVRPARGAVAGARARTSCSRPGRTRCGRRRRRPPRPTRRSGRCTPAGAPARGMSSDGVRCRAEGDDPTRPVADVEHTVGQRRGRGHDVVGRREPPQPQVTGGGRRDPRGAPGREGAADRVPPHRPVAPPLGRDRTRSGAGTERRDDHDDDRADDQARGRDATHRTRVAPHGAETRPVLRAGRDNLGGPGGVAEWFRQGSAKPWTWVQFPPPPPVTSDRASVPRPGPGRPSARMSPSRCGGDGCATDDRRGGGSGSAPSAPSVSSWRSPRPEWRIPESPARRVRQRRTGRRLRPRARWSRRCAA